MNKYGNRKACVDGIEFDSKLEANRWIYLKGLESRGLISNLQRQVKYFLIPAQYEPSTEFYKRGDKKGLPKPGELLENPVTYIADFVYTDNGGNTVVEDAKGFKTPDYIIKRKLMLERYGIRIKEVSK